MPVRPHHPAFRVWALAIVFFCGLPGVSLGQFTIEPDTIIAEDSFAPGATGPFTLIEYDLFGNILDTLDIVDNVGAGVLGGVAVVGDEIFVAGLAADIICQVDLMTGELVELFPLASPDVTDIAPFGNNLLVIDFFNNVYIHELDGTVVSDFSFPDSIGPIGIDTDGALIYVASWNNGNIYTFDLAGNFVAIIDTPAPAQSLASLDYVEETGTFLVSLGFDSDEIWELTSDGSIISTFPSGFGFVAGVQRVDPLPVGIPFIRGDADGNGSFTGLVDGLFLLNFQFVGGSPAPPCIDAADADDNGSFSGLVDGLYLLNYQFVAGSPPPPQPFDQCGIDPTDDTLPCAQTPCP